MQIIWTMLSDLLRFSVFLIVFIASFGASFYILFSDCSGEPNEAYGSLARSTLTMFKAMLGDFDFDEFASPGDCDRPSWANAAGTGLLVSYLVIMLVLLLNLLIAVLSTRHAEVHANAEKEFHLARAKLIQYSWKAVLYGRQPPPVNLVTPVLGFTVDALGGVLSALVKLCMR